MILCNAPWTMCIRSTLWPLLGLFVAAAASGGDLPAQSDLPSRPTTGTLLICGGGAIPDSVLARFVHLAGGEQARLVVIPTASERADSVGYLSGLAADWRQRGVGQVDFLHTRDRAQANDPEFVSVLREATAVWLGGGQQSRIADAYLGTLVEQELTALLARGGIIGGTSAGAAIQSRVMIAGGNPVPQIATGFDLLPGSIVDQHFLKRNRLPRLIEAVRRNPDRTGFGIDEGTAILVTNGTGEVLGASYVVVVTMPDGDHCPAIESLGAGDSIQIIRIDKRLKSATGASRTE